MVGLQRTPLFIGTRPMDSEDRSLVSGLSSVGFLFRTEECGVSSCSLLRRVFQCGSTLSIYTGISTGLMRLSQ